MTDTRTTDAVQTDADAAQADAVQKTQQLTAPAGLNLLGDESAGGCCGGGSCAMPGE
ncbi:hypothetical protein [Microbacterium sp.]|uniref:hypothetical protein n=1 Tax=Microbacterium sp. TaxID=51671 RepID=UPI003A94E146